MIENTRDKLINILASMAFNESIKEYINTEMHLFMTLLHDYGEDIEDNSWLKLIDIMASKEKEWINIVYDELILF